jgi:hypothetical protein
MARFRDWPSRRALLVAYVVVGIAAGFVSWAFGQSQNLDVFLQGARDVRTGADLYELHSTEWFKYSPTFALFFVPFLWMPTWLAGSLWSLLNFVSTFYGIDAVMKDPREKRIALTVALVGIVLVTDGDQSNLLIGGTMLLAYQALEDDRPWRFGFYAAVGTLVKIFPVLGLGFLVLHWRKWKAPATFLLFTAVLCFLPLLTLSWGDFKMEYASWRRLLSQESVVNHGWSIMGVFEKGFHWNVPNIWVQGVGAAILSLPFLRALKVGATPRERLSMMASLLAFVILFNHRTEYCTFVVSAAALGIWYALSPRTPAHTLLLVLAILAPGPIYTAVEPKLQGTFAFLGAHRRFHSLRMVPLLAVWIWIQKDLLFPPKKPGAASGEDEGVKDAR